jgi:hypothetical protein
MGALCTLYTVQHADADAHFGLVLVTTCSPAILRRRTLAMVATALLHRRGLQPRPSAPPQYAKRKIVTAMDVVYALKRQGRTLYGFGG